MGAINLTHYYKILSTLNDGNSDEYICDRIVYNHGKISKIQDLKQQFKKFSL